MVVVAKFKCNSVTKFEGGTTEVKMSAVMGNTPDNKAFNDYTPSGNINFLIAPEKPAAEYFKPGKEYNLQFTEA